MPHIFIIWVSNHTVDSLSVLLGSYLFVYLQSRFFIRFFTLHLVDLNTRFGFNWGFRFSFFCFFCNKFLLSIGLLIIFNQAFWLWAKKSNLFNIRLWGFVSGTYTFERWFAQTLLGWQLHRWLFFFTFSNRTLREHYIDCKLEHVLKHSGEQSFKQIARLFQTGIRIYFDQVYIEILIKNKIISK